MKDMIFFDTSLLPCQLMLERNGDLVFIYPLFPLVCYRDFVSQTFFSKIYPETIEREWRVDLSIPPFLISTNLLYYGTIIIHGQNKYLLLSFQNKIEVIFRGYHNKIKEVLICLIDDIQLHSASFSAMSFSQSSLSSLQPS